MCGICGLTSAIENNSIVEPVLKMMLKSLIHRGPDDEGRFVIPGQAALGIRRLSIMDVEKGHQPFFSEDGKIVTVCNGELYNFRELREELAAKGHVFKTNCDAEILPHLYEEHGDDFPTKINGMFGIGIWDGKSRKLLLVRDRFGIKPMYYTESAGFLAFGSEIKAILTLPGFKRTINSQAIYHNLTLGYTPQEHTPFEGIHCLLPGRTLSFNKSGKMQIKRYYKLSFAQAPHPGSEKEIGENLQHLIIKSIKRRLMSDVPLGVFLSGGLDSSTIATFASREMGKIETFSIAFEEKHYDESPWSRMMSKHIGSSHNELTLGAGHFMEAQPRVIEATDSPFPDGAAVPMYYLCQLARRKVTVALGGEGADEVFAGNGTQMGYRISNLYNRIPRPLFDMWARPLIFSLPVKHNKLSFEFRAKRFLKGVRLPAWERHLFWRTVCWPEDKAALFNPEMLKLLERETTPSLYEKYYRECDSSDNDLNRILYIDHSFMLPGDLLLKTDAMSMAHGLEARVPFLDHELVDYCAGLPPHLRLKYFRAKYLLKLAVKGSIPTAIIHRKKVGFDVPFALWLKNEMHDYMRNILTREMSRNMGFINHDYVEKLMTDHCSGRRNIWQLLWSLMDLYIWYQTYFIKNRFEYSEAGK